MWTGAIAHGAAQARAAAEQAPRAAFIVNHHEGRMAGRKADWGLCGPRRSVCREKARVALTRRNAKPDLIALAGLATEVKHPFKPGVKAQKGIEL